MARTMSLTRDFTSHLPPSRDSYSTSRPSSSGFISRPRRHTESDGAQPPESRRRKSASNLLDVDNSGYYDGTLGDDFLADGVRRSQREDDVAALIDFLRNHAPPPDNFMSIPYGGRDDDERGRWSKIKKISKRSKSMPRPQQIRLPDSAVSGTTTGGHRHIAISIPFDASPFGERHRSQYPVFGSEDIKRNAPPSAPIHTFTNEKGVVTVLRTVNEDREPASPSTPLGSHPPMPWSNAHRQSGSLGRSSFSTGRHSRGSTAGKLQDRASSSASSRTPIFDQYRTIRESNPFTEQRQGTAGSQSSQSFQRAAYPARGSSMVAPSVVVQPASIDGIISPTDSVKTAASGSREGVVRRSSSGGAEADGAGSKDAQQAKPRKVPKPLYFGDNMSMGGLIKERNDRLKPHTPALAESPLLPPNDVSGPPTPTGTRSRRDIVRDRKRRDIEAMRNAKLRQEQEQAYQLLQEQEQLRQREEKEEQLKQLQKQEEEAMEQAGERRVVDGNSSRLSTATITQATHDNRLSTGTMIRNAKDSRLSSSTVIHDPAYITGDKQTSDTHEEKPVSSQPTLAPIMIVVDVEPEYATEEQLTKDRGPVRRSSSVASFATAHDASLTPPHSASDEPSQKHSTLDDRTSLSRRREWNATREQERKTRETRDAARIKAKQLVAAGMPYEHVKASQTDREILRLYEAYRDHRMREMERRVRRLERNGDVWLRALVPVLDSVNRTMSGGQDDGTRDWRSDEDSSAAVDRQGPAKRQRPGRDGVPRRASLSQGRLLEELARKKEEADRRPGESRGSTGSGNSSDDTTGLGSIEPLMRELAGEARRRQKTAERLGVGADGRIFHAL